MDFERGRFSSPHRLVSFLKACPLIFLLLRGGFQGRDGEGDFLSSFCRSGDCCLPFFTFSVARHLSEGKGTVKVNSLFAALNSTELTFFSLFLSPRPTFMRSNL